MQYEQQNEGHIHEYEMFFLNFQTHNLLLDVLTKNVVTIYIFTGDNKVVEPDPLSEGFTGYAECNMEHFVFEFFLNYVRRIKSDSDWRKLLKKNPEKPFLLFVTPSDIAFVLSLIKNGMDMWDQFRRLQDNPTLKEIKALPLFTKGEGRKRESGRTVWNNEGLNFYYTAEKNWKKVYNNKEELSDMCNKWERWEPDDKGRKKPVKTFWRRIEEEKNNIGEEENNESWWEKETNLGYDSGSDGEPDFDWDDDVKKGKSYDDNSA